jgi:hypothetical protein
MSDAALKTLDAIFFLGMFIGVPAMAGAIGYAAWKGKPKTLSRDFYITMFLFGVIFTNALYFYGRSLDADVRTWLFLGQSFLTFLLILVLGVTFGCFIGFFAYRRSPPPSKPRG